MLFMVVESTFNEEPHEAMLGQLKTRMRRKLIAITGTKAHVVKTPQGLQPAALSAFIKGRLLAAKKRGHEHAMHLAALVCGLYLSVSGLCGRVCLEPNPICYVAFHSTMMFSTQK